MLYLYLTFSPVACVKLCCQWISGRRLHSELSVATLFPSDARSCDIVLWRRDSTNDLTVQFHSVENHHVAPLLFPDNFQFSDLAPDQIWIADSSGKSHMILFCDCPSDQHRCKKKKKSLVCNDTCGKQRVSRLFKIPAFSNLKL